MSPSARPAPSTQDIVHAAATHYLAGRAIDMSGLAAELGLSRATLYRRVGQHDYLIGLVLAEQTSRTFAHVLAHTPGSGTGLIRAVLERFMTTVVGAEALRALIERDPVLFVRVVMAPGPVESTATGLLTGLLDEQAAAGALRLRIPAGQLAQAMVRVGDSFMYTHLLGRGECQIPSAVAIMDLLLDSAITSR